MTGVHNLTKYTGVEPVQLDGELQGPLLQLHCTEMWMPEVDTKVSGQEIVRGDRLLSQPPALGHAAISQLAIV